ncbi:MAG: SMC-Scp complex subunit ScpB [Candidatus Diapherotrites archaeon]
MELEEEMQQMPERAEGTEEKAGKEAEEKGALKELMRKPENISKIEKMRKLIEATLFMSPKPVSIEEISKVVNNKNLALLEGILSGLIEEYNLRDSAIEIVREADGFKMKIRKDFEQSVMHLAGTVQYSKAVMKTLAYIAYRQPVKQSQVIKFRSTKAYEEIKLLEEKGLISKEKKGVTYIVRTTKKFLEYFGEDSVMLKENLEREESTQ